MFRWENSMEATVTGEYFPEKGLTEFNYTVL